MHSITTTSAIEIFITFLREPYKGLVRLILWPNFTDARGLPGAGPGLVRSVVTLHPLLSALVGEPIDVVDGQIFIIRPDNSLIILESELSNN